MVWTAKQVNAKLNDLTAGDAHVELGYNGGKPNRESYATFKEYLKAHRKAEGYFCIDTYRPGLKFWGKTPKDAAQNAGFTLSTWISADL